VLISRIRALVLGMLAVLLAGSVMAATAAAEAGPFWHHRPVGAKEVGLKIEPKGPENFRGKGGEQTLKGTIGAEPVVISSAGVEVKGAIFNSANQGQIKLEIVYKQPVLVSPKKPGCVVTVGAKNIVVVKGHLMWKWNGEKKQIEEQPQLNQKWDIGFTAIEPQQQKPVVEKVKLTNNGTFTTVALKDVAACATLAGTFNVSGSAVGIPSLSQLEEWSKKLQVRTVESQTGKFLQHYWDGTAFQGAELGLTFANNPASLIGQTEVEAEQQEISVFEK
jgi:hypothetical protein